MMSETDPIDVNRSGPDGMALPRFLYSESIAQSSPLLQTSEPKVGDLEMTATVRSDEDIIGSELELNLEVNPDSDGVPRTLEEKPPANGRGTLGYNGTLPSTLSRSTVNTGQ